MSHPSEETVASLQPSCSEVKLLWALRNMPKEAEDIKRVLINLITVLARYFTSTPK